MKKAAAAESEAAKKTAAAEAEAAKKTTAESGAYVNRPTLQCPGRKSRASQCTRRKTGTSGLSFVPTTRKWMVRTASNRGTIKGWMQCAPQHVLWMGIQRHMLIHWDCETAHTVEGPHSCGEVD